MHASHDARSYLRLIILPLLLMGIAGCATVDVNRSVESSHFATNRIVVPAAVANFTSMASPDASTSPGGEAPLAEPGSERQTSDSPSQTTYPINFSTALKLVAGQNPRIGFAIERINEALAELNAAQTLWLPSVRAGGSYNWHDGRLQSAQGGVSDVERSSFQSGLGVGAVGTGTQAFPGVEAVFHVADAIFAPLIAERTAAARRYAVTATTNDLLLSTALAYLDLLSAQQQLEIAEETLANTKQLADLTALFAETGQGPQADADRAQTELAVRTNDATRGEEAVQVASARLAQVLSLEAGMSLRPQETTMVAIELVSPELPLAELLATGLSNRPELAQSKEQVSGAIQRLQRERYAPLVPSVRLGMSYAGFGGGPGSSRTTDDSGDRVDFNAVVYWEIRNLGFGEKAARAATLAQLRQAEYREIELTDQVAREVAEAHAQAQARKRQIDVASSGVQSAIASYRRNVQRITEGQGLPIEVLQSIQALDRSRRAYLGTLVDYNAAQFRLQRALGWPISG